MSTGNEEPLEIVEPVAQEARGFPYGNKISPLQYSKHFVREGARLKETRALPPARPFGPKDDSDSRRGRRKPNPGGAVPDAVKMSSGPRVMAE